MIGSNFWKDNIQKDNIEKRTYVVFDGVDLSQYITNYSMNDFLDLDGKSSVYGAIGVREISISILGNHPKYNQVTIHHGIKVDDVWVDELLGTFNLLEPTYDEGAKETIYKTNANQYDELVTSTITTGSTPIEYLQGQSVIQVDSTEWTLGDEIIVSSPDTAFYETYKEMAIDMGKSTMSFGIPRYDKLAYRNFTDIDYRVDWVFDLKQGEVMLPVNRLNLATTLGDNVAEKVKNLIKDDFSDFTPYQGAVVTRNKTFPIEVFKGGRNLALDSDDDKRFNETITTSTDNSTHDTNSNLTWMCYENLRWSDFD